MIRSKYLKGTMLVLFGVALTTSACDCDSAGTGTPGLSKTCGYKVTATDLPASTNEKTLDVSGTGHDVERPVFYAITNANGMTRTGIAAPIPALKIPGAPWSGTIELEEGDNTVYFFQGGANAEDTCGTGLLDHIADGGTFGDGSDGPGGATGYDVLLDSEAPGLPSVETEIPECLSPGEFVLEGTIDADAMLTVNGENATVEDGKFSVTIDVESGGTPVTLVAVDAAGNQSEEVKFELTAGLGAPSLNPIVSPTNMSTQTITGEKERGVDVILTVEGAAGQPLSDFTDRTTWEYTFDPLQIGENTFTLTARDAAGNESCEPSGPHTIIFADICELTVNLDSVTTPTNNPTANICAERCDDVGVWTRVRTEGDIADPELSDGQSSVEVGASGEVCFEVTLSEGENTVLVNGWQDIGGETLWGPTASVDIVLDTTPPEPPVYDPEPPAQTAEDEIDLRGTKEPGTSLCIRRDQDPECVPVNGNRGGSFNVVNVPLDEGNNFICLSAIDEVGNVSEPACITIERTPDNRPSVSIITPLANSTVGAEPFSISASVQVPENTTLQEVRLCFDDDCATAPFQGDAQVGVVTDRDYAPNENLENGTIHQICAQADALSSDVVITGEACIEVLYVNGGLVISTSAPEELSFRAQVALDAQGRFHVIWEDNCAQQATCDDSQEGNLPGDIFHRVFDGQVWSAITLVSSGLGDGSSEWPHMTTDPNGNIHVVWHDDGDVLGSGEDYDILYRMLNTATDVWGDISLLTIESAERDRRPRVAASTTQVFVTWERVIDADNTRRLMYSASTNGVWSDAELISENATGLDVALADIVVTNDNDVFFAWQQETTEEDQMENALDRNDIFMRILEDNILGDVIQVSDINQVLDGNSRNPKLAVDSRDRVHVVWTDDSTAFLSGDDNDVFHRIWDGNDWLGNGYILATNDAMDGSSEEPGLTIDTNTDSVFVTWTDNGDIAASGSDPDVYFSRLIGDAVWTAPQLISAGFNGTSEYAVSRFEPTSRNLYLIWEDDTTTQNDGEDRDVYFLSVSVDDL